MKEYTIVNKNTKEEKIIWGYNVKNAFSRYPVLNSEEWKVIFFDYSD